ncbi:aminoacyltransferase [Nosocomiicoccus sp. HMSC067E10]|uniref:peptidoglycan bridge formation glycyltransferase FemA/FemB family protein n=1 Tax=Nosocomiicoccus sp. HMSC067E10 TaxID=1739271 RepID=UPI0008A61385|nr:peptidoglycan bridge formation glycyltransferase FemA/FemB family protein [Nosocomiicoccus sp. HMSC067E10]OFL46180.1 aminoacyltransferase [Nosocomiicoccus sp. HMSC067E10]
MKFVQLTDEEYKNFIENDGRESAFFQMIENKANRLVDGRWEVELLGLKDKEDKVIAAGLFTKEPSVLGKYFYYSNRGPVLDYDNLNIVRAYFAGLTEYLKQNDASLVKVDPNWIYKKYDKDVKPYDDYENRDEVIQLLESMGYVHQGFTRGYSNTSQARWMSVLDVSQFKNEDELVKSFDNLRRRNMRKAKRYGVKVRFLEVDEMDIFVDMYLDTAERQDFFVNEDPRTYFKQFKETYKDKVLVPLAYIELDPFIEQTEKEVNKLQKQKEKQEKKENQNQKTLNRINELERNIEGHLNDLEKAKEFREKYGNVLNLGSGVYFVTPYELVYNAGASSEEFNMFVGPYMMHLEMMKYAMDHGIARYNFYGVSGDFSEDGEDYGVYRFKRGFNAQIEELVGDFVKVIHPLANNVNKVKAKLKQKLGKR